MGLFDSLFGGGSKANPAPQEQSEAAAVVKTAGTVSAELAPELVAAIAASISCLMDTSASAELAVRRGDGAYPLKSGSTSSAWALTARQKLMDARQFM
jgi:hypothetical protein